MRRAAGLLLFIALCVFLLFAQRKESDRLVRHPSRGTRAALATGSEAAREAGLRIFLRGGNAVDAGVASMLAAAIAEYSHFGFGGEAPILIRAKDGKVWSISGIGTMPKLATADLFRTRPLRVGEVLMLEPGGLKPIIPAAGLMPALVPGMPEAALVALREFGTLSFAEVAASAIELADGMPIDEMRAGYILRSQRFFDLWPDSKRVFLPEGRPPIAGEIFRQTELARTLRAMVDAERRALKSGVSRTAAIDAVRDYFYRGDVARRIDAFSRANEGLLRYDDMAGFRLEPEAPVSTTYHGYTIHKPGFWSQGPAMIEALNLLESYDVKTLGLNTPDYIHTSTEAMKLAYADRDTYYGDPKFVEIPAERLLSKDYAAERRAGIAQRASFEFLPGEAGGQPRQHPAAAEFVRLRIDDELAARDTTCINAVDRDGVMFSATPSGAWLPSVIAGDTGVPLTQRAQSFFLIRGHPNELAGGKRPRVTLSPTIVTRDGKPFMTIATPGGDVQEQGQIQVFLNVVEFGMSAQGAVEAPRFETRHLVSSFDNHAMNPGHLLLDERIAGPAQAMLTARGHKVTTLSRWNSGSRPVAIRVLPNGVMEAGADPYGHRVSAAW